MNKDLIEKQKQMFNQDRLPNIYSMILNTLNKERVQNGSKLQMNQQIYIKIVDKVSNKQKKKKNNFVNDQIKREMENINKSINRSINKSRDMLNRSRDSLNNSRLSRRSQNK